MFAFLLSFRSEGCVWDKGVPSTQGLTRETVLPSSRTRAARGLRHGVLSAGAGLELQCPVGDPADESGDTSRPEKAQGPCVPTATVGEFPSGSSVFCGQMILLEERFTQSFHTVGLGWGLS